MNLHYQNKEIKEINGEIFKPYPVNTQYLVSTFGRVKSKQQIVTHNYGGRAIKKERVLTQTDNGSGYLSVGLTENGKTKNTRVSRIVAITFIKNDLNKPQVNHINGNKKDNRVENLEWNTSGENVRHAWNNDLAKKQSSFIYIKERLEKINPYITNKVRVQTPIGFGTVIIDQNCYRIEYDNGKFENLVKALRFWQDDFKLCLRNLSDLTKEIEHNGEKFIPIYKIFNPPVPIDQTQIANEVKSYNLYAVIKKNDVVVYSIKKDYNVIPFWIVQKLIEWKFNLMDENEPFIDVNTLEINPYK